MFLSFFYFFLISKFKKTKSLVISFTSFDKYVFFSNCKTSHVSRDCKCPWPWSSYDLGIQMTSTLV